MTTTTTMPVIASSASSPRPSRLHLIGVAAALGAVTTLTGCAGVRVVHRNQAGGTLALQGFPDKAMEAAHRTMAAHCGPGNYTVVSEGEEVIGSVTTGSASTSTNKKKTLTLASGSSETTNKTEQRLQYQCNQYLGQYVAPPTASSFAAGQPAQPAQPMPPPGQPYAVPGQPYAAPAQPYPAQPYPPQPAPGQPYAQPAYYQPVPQPGAPYPQQPYPAQPYPPQAPPPAPAAPR